MTEHMGYEKTRHVEFDWHNQRPVAYGYKFRSKEEYKWATWLELLKMSGEIASWKYEPTEFEFQERYRKRLTYTPDFLVVGNDGTKEFQEVKAGLTGKGFQVAIRKLKYMAVDFPDERIVLVVPSNPKWGSKSKERLDKARKYVADVIFSGPIFRKLGL